MILPSTEVPDIFSESLLLLFQFLFWIIALYIYIVTTHIVSLLRVWSLVQLMLILYEELNLNVVLKCDQGGTLIQSVVSI